MKPIFKRIVSLFLLFYSGILVSGQPVSYSSVSAEIKSLQKQLLPDKRTDILNIELKDTFQAVITLKGETDLPDAKAQIINYLKSKNISFIDSLKLLPDQALGDKTWGLASISVANIYAGPSNVSELVSQILMGTPVKVLSKKKDWLRIQTPEHYIGWVDSSGLQLLTSQELDSWKKSDRFLFKQLSGFAYDKPSQKGNIVSDLVLCNLFVAEPDVKGFLKIRIPDGRIAYVKKSDCISFKEWSESDPDIQSVLSIAKKMMGTPYLWGGVSSKAADCSGFVKLAYYYQGVILARDASQQALHGEKIDFTNMTLLKPGDLLFFGNSAQHITHVGMYIDNGNFIHCSGKVHIGSIIPGNINFNPARNKVGACRIINSLNTDGITRVKDHPWYVEKL